MATLPAPDRHGAELRNLLKALACRFETDVMALKGPEQAVVERVLRARVLRVPLAASGQPGLGARVDGFRRAIRRQIECDEYEVIHFRDAFSGLPICQRKAELPSRLVFDIAAPGLAADEKFCLEQADLILCPTQHGRRHLEQMGLGARVAVVPPGVDIDHFDAQPEPAPERPVVLYVGGLAPGRCTRLLLEACAQLAPAIDHEVWLVGPVDPSFRDALAAAVQSFGLGERTKQMGPISPDDLPRLYARATVCVVPDAPDEAERPFAAPPLALLEALACRKPAIAPRCLAVAEVIRDGEEGLLFAPGSAAELAACLRRLLGEASVREALAAAGHRVVRERYAASSARRQLLEAYARIIDPAHFHPVAALGAGTIAADTTRRRTSWVAERPGDLVPPADAVDGLAFEAAGSLLDGSASEKMDESSGETKEGG